VSEHTFFGVLLGAWLALAAVTFLVLLRVAAPYGRHARRGWGPTVPAPVGWFLMELPAVLVPAVLFAVGDRRGPTAIVFLLLWEIHYVHRAIVYPLRRRGGGRRMPLSVMGMAFLFNVVNGYLNGRYLFALGPYYPPSWLVDERFLAGAALFVVGLSVNLHADGVLLHLQRRRDGYAIPRGGLYRFVSCPNYLGEIVEWAGWAVATWSLPGLSFAAWTTANLAPRALAHHRWYRERFPDYPPERRALVPFLL
jgi:protein-S-isoprenylcysteine O-methyltransferase Ste14